MLILLELFKCNWNQLSLHKSVCPNVFEFYIILLFQYDICTGYLKLENI